MDKENKKLLLKDLCTRLPYGVKIWVKWDKNPSPLTTSILGNYWYTVGDDIKPYLRSMLNMTEEEGKELGNITVFTIWTPKVYEWYIEHHFDIHNLIEKGLAIEAPEGMYKTE